MRAPTETIIEIKGSKGNELYVYEGCSLFNVDDDHKPRKFVAMYPTLDEVKAFLSTRGEIIDILVA